ALLAALARRHLLPGSLGGDRSLQGLLLPGLLLAGDGLLLALAGTRVGLRPLTVHREPLAVPDALVAADLDLTADVRGDLAPQVTLDLVVRVDPLAQLLQVLFAQRVDPRVTVYAGRGEGLGGPGAADAVDVGQRDLKPLLTRQVDARETCHTGSSPSCGGGPPHRFPPLPEAAPASNRGVRAVRPPALRALLAYSILTCVFDFG